VARFSASAAIRLATLMSALFAACTSTRPIPPVFDSIQRLPVKTVTVNGYRVAYLDSGQGPPVVLVHGLGGSLWQWEYQQGPLSATHRLITLDLLGAGYSDKPDIDYTPEVMLEFFRSFLDTIGIERASLVGNSMGGGIVIGMALTYPERVDRLVLIDGLPDHVRDRTPNALLRRTIDTRVPVWLIKLGSFFAGRNATSTILKEIVHDPALLTPAVLDRSDRNRSGGGIIGPVMSLARNLPQWEEGFAKRLAEIRQRTLIIWGEEDRLFPPQAGRDLQATIPGSSLALIPNAGHIPQWEQPQVVNPLLLQFLEP